jgi:hypothetical protein
MRDEPPPNPRSRPPESPMLTMVGLGEEVVDHLLALGALLVLTSTRVLVVQEGARIRQRNEIRSWPFGLFRDAEFTPPRGGCGRVVLRFGTYPWKAVSLYISATEWAAAERVVGTIRVRGVARSRPPTLTLRGFKLGGVPPIRCPGSPISPPTGQSPRS